MMYNKEELKLALSDLFNRLSHDEGSLNRIADAMLDGKNYNVGLDACVKELGYTTWFLTMRLTKLGDRG